MAVTIIDVAEKAGVSPSTVSRVISNDSRISQKTSRKVRKIMDELGYHPNVMAKSLVTKTTNNIGVILPALRMSCSKTNSSPKLFAGL